MSTLLRGNDYSSLGERGIRGAFYDQLESDQDANWSRAIGFYFPSDSAAETHRWLGQVASLREWVGSRLSKGLRVESFAITNVLYEGTLELPVLDLRRDKTGQLKVKGAQGLGVRANQHWDQLGAALVELNPTCYDGLALYSAAHVSGDSGVQSNALTVADIPALNVADTSAIMVDEALEIIMRVCPYFWSYLDDKGQPANQDARDFLFVVPWRMLASFQVAINRLMVATGGDNPLSKIGRFRAAVAVEPRLTSQTVGYVFRVDADRSAGIILQEEIQPEFDFFGESSEYARLNNVVRYQCKASRAAAPGQWRHTVRFTIS